MPFFVRPLAPEMTPERLSVPAALVTPMVETPMAAVLATALLLETTKEPAPVIGATSVMSRL